MNLLRMIGAAAAAGAVVGCSQMKWHHDSMEFSEQQRTWQECQFEGVKATSGIREPFQAAFAKQDVIKACMLAKGFRQVPK